MATGPAESADKWLLRQDDVLEVVEKLLDVQTKAEILGRVLKLPRATVQAVIQQYSNPQDRLVQVVDEFVKQVEPRPTWRVILQALRNPLINEPQLALDIERNICLTRHGLVKEDQASVTENKHELVQALQTQKVVQDLVTENANLQSRVQELQQKLQSRNQSFERDLRLCAQSTKDRELVGTQRQLTQKEEELRIREAELAKSEETLRRNQQQMLEETALMQARYRTRPNLRKTEEWSLQFYFFLSFLAVVSLALLLSFPLGVFPGQDPQSSTQAKDREVVKTRQKSRMESASCMCQVSSGPGLASATVNHSARVLVELTDCSGLPYPLEPNVTAQLEIVSKDTPNSQSMVSLPVAMMSPGRYEVSYTPVSRGQQKLSVKVNNREIHGSPFPITAFAHPTNLGVPVKTLTGFSWPYGIGFNRHGEMIVSKHRANKVSIFSVGGRKIKTFGSHGSRAHHMITPKAVAIDDTDNIYVSSEHKVQKFTRSGEFVRFVGGKGKMEGKFSDPRGVTVFENQVYVCDHNNHRVQVFDLELNFVKSIGSRGEGEGEFRAPFDVKFDTSGNMYVLEYGNKRVQVMDRSGRFLRAFGAGKLGEPSGLHISDRYVYLSDHICHCVVVYETSGEYVTTLGRRGEKEGEFWSPNCITSCANGFIHVSDSWNNRIHIF